MQAVSLPAEPQRSSRISEWVAYPLFSRWGRSTGEGIGHPLKHSWASLVVQLVKNLPAMQETRVQSLGLEDPMEKGKATPSSILVWRIPWTVYSMGSQKVGHDWATFTSLHFTSQVILSKCKIFLQFLCMLYFFLTKLHKLENSEI